jgi:hypothetical protein
MRPSTLLVPLLLALPAAAQTTWYVDLAGTPPGSGTRVDPYVSIQAAIDAPATVHGDTILVAPGEYHETLDYDAKSVTVRATEGPLPTVLSPAAPGDFYLVTMGEPGMAHPPAVLEGFTVRRDPPGSGVGVRTLANSQGRLVGCIVTGHGVGCVNNYDLFLERCTVAGNTTGIGGDSVAIHYLESTICRGNGQDMVGGAFGPCFSATWSCFTTDTFVYNCGFDVGNFGSAPLFWDQAGGDLHLAPGSPCIDAGDPAAPLDPDGTRIDVGALTYDPAYAPSGGTFCAGSYFICPCANAGSGAAGCDLAQGTGGIAIAVQGFAPDGLGGGTAEVTGSGYPAMGQPGVTLIRSPGFEDPPVVFGDGLRCIAAAGLVRVSATLAQGGVSLNPVMHGAGAGTFYYQLWARNTPISFCDPAAAFNLSNALTLTW